MKEDKIDIWLIDFPAEGGVKEAARKKGVKIIDSKFKDTLPDYYNVVSGAPKPKPKAEEVKPKAEEVKK